MSAAEPDKAGHGGLLSSIRNLIATLLAMGQTRLDLLATELEEERAYLTSMLVWILIALFCAALAIVLATLLVVVIFWDSYRLVAISVLICMFALGAFVAWRIVSGMIRTKPRLFSASIAELSKDREQLKAVTDE